MAHITEPGSTKRRRDVVTVIFAILVSLLLAGGMGSVALVWQRLDRSERNQAALAAQVKQLGGTPVVEPKAGERGDAGPQGPPGPAGPEGPVGPRGPQGPIGITGQTPRCILEPSRCVGPKGDAGAAGAAGKDGSQGPAGQKGEPGAAGQTGPQGPVGPQGDPGAVGPAGPQGGQGPAGRGIADTDCLEDGTWRISYTDNTSQIVRGPCRVLVGPPVEPTN